MLTSALGMASAPRFTLGYLDKPQVGDSFLLASDGLWAYFKSNELCHILSTMSAKAATKLLMELARERGDKKGDNISVIVIKLAVPDAKDPMTVTAAPASVYNQWRK
jgi:PPM family protein phosphatase